MPTRRYPRIPEHRQLTRLQVYDVASALWPWRHHSFRKRRRLDSSSANGTAGTSGRQTTAANRKRPQVRRS